MIIHYFSTLWILFGTFLAFSVAFGFAVRKSYPHQWFWVTLYLIFGICQLNQAVINSPFIWSLSAVLFIDIPLIYLLAPITYFAFNIWIRPSVQFRFKDGVHLILPVLALVYFWPFFGMSSSAKLGYLFQSIQPTWSIFKVVWMGCVVANLGYLSVLVWENPALISRKGDISGIIKLPLVVLIVLLSIYLAAFIWGSNLLFWIGDLVEAGLMVIFYVIFQRYPDQIQKATTILQEKYKNSQIKHLDLDHLNPKLSELMTEKRLYEDPELTLHVCAKKVDLTAHQLSEHLNANFGKTFKQWINQYRVEAAKALLLTQPHLTVLGIGLRVGFNSSTTFHTVFKASTGNSPHQFRNSSPTL